jgi:predicted Fe-Mo cluster-binding NifX family protein
VTSRVLIPTQDFEGKMVAAHFGRAPYFVVIRIEENILVGKVMLMIMFYNTNHKQ